MLRFGKYLDTKGPGYNWHLPWPIDRKIVVNVSQQNSITDDASMLTADTNLVEVKSAVQYIQPDAVKYLFSVREIEKRIQKSERFGKAPDPAVTTPAGVTFRIALLLPSATYTLPALSTVTAVRPLNLAAVPVPSALPEVPFRPASVVTTPAGVTLRTAWLPQSPTYRLPELSSATP